MPQFFNYNILYHFLADLNKKTAKVNFECGEDGLIDNIKMIFASLQ